MANIEQRDTSHNNGGGYEGHENFGNSDNGDRDENECDTGKIKPKVHHFGHIHESYGTLQIDNTIFINSSICNLMYRPDNKPITIDL